MEETVNAPGVENGLRDLKIEMGHLYDRLGSIIEYLGMIAASLEGIKEAILNGEVSK